jgi:hypothetical protein
LGSDPNSETGERAAGTNDGLYYESSTKPRPHILAFFVLSLPAGAIAQPTTSLTRKTGTAAEPFSNATAVQELRDGRVLVADAKERVLSIVNFESGGEVKQLGRNGSGPNEYASAQTLLRGRGDTILLLDFPARRVLRIAPNGTLAGTQVFDMSPGDTLPGEKPLGDRISSAPRYTDANGAMYFEVGYIDQVKRGVRPERLLARWDPVTRASKRMATINAWYPDKSSRWRAPFMYQDLWAVAPDGRVARVVPVDYHVEWYKDGALVARGAPVPYTPVRVTKDDRDAWYRARASQGGVGRAQMTGPPPTPGSEQKDRAPVSRPPGFTDADFPDVKPPFVEDYVGRSMLVTNEGEVWVMRAPAFDAKTTEADVFDGAGKLVRRLSMPSTYRVAGVGKSSLYMIRTDDDGLQWLERYAR